MNEQYAVRGMTCEHCVRAVTEEVSEITGVTGVRVDLASGTLEIDGAASTEQVRAAVEEAGYTLG